MTCSPARLEANRKNALHSSGPRTPEGKERSRANALKHGLTGEGIALPQEDAAEVGRRFAAMQAELRPGSEAGRFLVQRAALMMVRLDRCARHEAAALSERVARAGTDFDEARLRDARELLGAIAADPAEAVRKLRATPEGVDRLIAALREVGDHLTHPTRRRHVDADFVRVENLMGRLGDSLIESRVGALIVAMWIDGSLLEPGEAAGLADPDRREWARLRLAGLIDAEVADLRRVRDDFDPEAIARDRAGAADRALFDPSQEAANARKYEAAAERGLYRALRELEQVEARVAEAAEAPPADPAPLGSSLPEADAPEPPRPPAPARPIAPPTPAPFIPRFERIGAANDGPMSLGTIGRGPA